MRGEGVQGGGPGGRVDDADEVVALTKALVEAIAVAQRHIAAVGRPAGPAGQPARSERGGQDVFGAVRQVAHHEVAGHVQAGQPRPVGRQGGEDPAARREHGLRAGAEVAAPYGEQSVPVVGVHECRAVGCPGRGRHIARGGHLKHLAGRSAARRPGGPQGVERGEGDAAAVRRQGGQVQRADGPGARALEVVRLAAVAGPVHGQRGREGNLLAVPRRVRVDQAEVSVDREEQPLCVRPAGRGGEDVARHGDRLTVHDKGAGGGRCGCGPQVGQAPGGRDGGGHQLGAGVVGVLHADGARPVGGHGRDGGRPQGARRGDTGPHEQHPLAVRRPGRVEVLPAGVLSGALLTRAPGEPGQRAGAHVHDPDAVRGTGDGVPTAFGGERDPGAIRRPGGTSVVPRSVGELPQPGAVGPQRPEVEASAAVGADGEAAAVGRELGAGGFEAGRADRDRGAALPREGPEHVLHLGDQPVTGRGEGRGTTRGGGEGEGGRSGGGGRGRRIAHGRHRGRGCCCRGGGGGDLEESTAGERTGTAGV